MAWRLVLHMSAFPIFVLAGAFWLLARMVAPSATLGLL